MTDRLKVKVNRILNVLHNGKFNFDTIFYKIFKNQTKNTKDMGKSIYKTNMDVIVCLILNIMLRNNGNVDKKLKLSVLIRSRENHVSPHSVSDGRKNISKYREPSLLVKSYLNF